MRARTLGGRSGGVNRKAREKHVAERKFCDILLRAAGWVTHEMKNGGVVAASLRQMVNRAIQPARGCMECVWKAYGTRMAFGALTFGTLERLLGCAVPIGFVNRQIRQRWCDKWFHPGKARSLSQSRRKKVALLWIE